jgi:integrase
VATIFKRGRCWYLNWHDADGQHRPSLGEIAELEARAALKLKEAELATGRSLTPTAAPLFRDYAVSYLAWYGTEYEDSLDSAERILETRLVPTFGHLSLDQINAALVEAWKARRAGQDAVYRNGHSQGHKVKSATVNKELLTLKAMLNRAVDWELLTKNPARAVKPIKGKDSKPPHYYPKPQLKQIYRAAEPQHRAAWRLLANTGLRRGEGLHLRRRNVIAGEKLHVLSEAGARTKSGKWREIPLNKPALEALETLEGADYVLPRVAPQSLSRAFLRDARAAQVPGNLHSLRHTFISHLVMAGAPLRTVQILAGHAHYKTTERYAHLAPEHLAGALGGLSL